MSAVADTSGLQVGESGCVYTRFEQLAGIVPAYIQFAQSADIYDSDPVANYLVFRQNGFPFISGLDGSCSSEDVSNRPYPIQPSAMPLVRRSASEYVESGDAVVLRAHPASTERVSGGREVVTPVPANDRPVWPAQTPMEDNWHIRP